MPRLDGTGPMGFGSMTGRGFGPCADEKSGAVNDRRGRGRAAYGRGMGRGGGYARGFGRGRAFGRGFYMDQEPAQDRKEFLETRKDYLKSQVEVIDDELDNL
ncbi:MAG: DUF5320 domain-containing protein [Eubacteriales bacterium]|nr:DUF5320 domain-containing protein [Eubacteriales bacterium]